MRLLLIRWPDRIIEWALRYVADRQRHMKTKKMIGVAVVIMLVAASLTCWIGYHHRSSPSRVPLISNVKVLGVAFRTHRNDIAQFTITGPVVRPAPQTQEP